MNTLFTELKRRNIFRVAGVYAVVGWILMQVAALLENSLNLPTWFDTIITAALLIGFPIAMLLAWAFEMTPEGVKRTEHVADGDSVTDKTGRKLDFAILGGLVLVGVLVVGSRFMPQKMAAPEIVVDAQTEEKISIAVLPFEDFSSGKDQEYFANGISEELLNVLARIDGLRVSSRTSSFAFKERNASTGEIAEALGVKHILEGSIRKSGATLRITAQLIDTLNDEHMWSETYDRPLTAENLFAVQDEIAAAIVAELKGQFNFAPAKQAPRTNSLEAYELYLRARIQMNKRKPDTLAAAVQGYQQVLALDPEFAPAYSGLAETYLLMSQYTNMLENESIRRAKPNVERALQLAPNTAESLTTAAFFAAFEKRYDQALVLANRAIAANPNYADAFLRKARVLWQLGRKDEFLMAIQKAWALDPLSSVILSNLSDAQLAVGDRDAAKRTLRDNVRWNPESPFGLQGLARLSYEDGDIAAAHSLHKDALALNPEGTNSQSGLASIYMDVGMYGEVSRVSKQPADIALALIFAGQKEQGLKLARDNLNTASMAFVLFASGDVKGAYPYAQKFVTESNLLQAPTNRNMVGVFAAIAFIYQENGDGDANIFSGKVQTYLGADVRPADKIIANDLQTGMILQLIKGEEGAAYAWIDRYLDLGFAGEAFFTAPPFDALRGTPEFAKRETRMKQNAAKHRAEIEAQLENPKPNWVKVLP